MIESRFSPSYRARFAAFGQLRSDLLGGDRLQSNFVHN
jgi:hypothetical protein